MAHLRFVCSDGSEMNTHGENEECLNDLRIVLGDTDSPPVHITFRATGYATITENPHLRRMQENGSF